MNGETFGDDVNMHADVRALCDNVMSVIENNGEVTLPTSRSERRVTTRQLLSMVLIAGTVVALVWAAVGNH